MNSLRHALLLATFAVLAGPAAAQDPMAELKQRLHDLIDSERFDEASDALEQARHLQQANREVGRLERDLAQAEANASRFAAGGDAGAAASAKNQAEELRRRIAELREFGNPTAATSEAGARRHAQDLRKLAEQLRQSGREREAERVLADADRLDAQLGGAGDAPRPDPVLPPPAVEAPERPAAVDPTAELLEAIRRLTERVEAMERRLGEHEPPKKD